MINAPESMCDGPVCSGYCIVKKGTSALVELVRQMAICELSCSGAQKKELRYEKALFLGFLDTFKLEVERGKAIEKNTSKHDIESGRLTQENCKMNWTT